MYIQRRKTAQLGELGKFGNPFKKITQMISAPLKMLPIPLPPMPGINLPLPPGMPSLPGIPLPGSQRPVGISNPAPYSIMPFPGNFPGNFPGAIPFPMPGQATTDQSMTVSKVAVQSEQPSQASSGTSSPSQNMPDYSALETAANADAAKPANNWLLPALAAGAALLLMKG